jgi:tight adherence protein B
LTALLSSVAVTLGLYWLYTSLAFGWSGLGFGPRITNVELQRRRADLDVWLTQAGLEDVNHREFFAVVLLIFSFGSAIGFAIFAGPIPAIVVGGFSASFPVATYRLRRQHRRERAREAWPRMIEEIRLQTASMGRSIPRALFEVGRRGPEELHPGFEAAHREWLLTTDFQRTIQVLKERLADPTADLTAETLLIAYELGGTDLDQRLEALAEDRRQDLQGRKDARSRQAGARFSRVFVLAVPGGMALAGISIGDGRAAYQTGGGQLIVLAALAMVITCWVWAGRVMQLPEPDRVFTQ